MKSERHHTCPSCKGPASLSISTGIRFNDEATTGQPDIQIPGEEGAVRLAAHLGLTTAGFHLNSRRNAADRLRELWSELMPSDSEQVQCRHPIVCCFCAKYLPSLVAAYKADPRPTGPYHVMLLGVAQSVYFAKFMRTPSGADLYHFYVSQVLIPQCWKCAGPEIVSSRTVTLLILSTYAHEYKSQIGALSEPIILQLKEWLRARAVRAIKVMQLLEAAAVSRDNDFYGLHESIVQTGASTFNILDGKLKHDALRLSLTRRETFDRYAALHEDPNDAELRRRECVRCQTVAYCCRTHQRDDWAGHKERCFETVY